jgi:CRISPR-associated protein Csx17
MPELILPGCTLEPLMSYLKALGVLRLVSEQADADARGAWRNGVFVLETKLDADELVRFFLEDYRPTPIVVPWSGGDFFAINRKQPRSVFVKTPTAASVIEAFLATQTNRLSDYREVIRKTLETMDRLGITKKKHIEGTSGKKTKARLLAHLRSVLPDEFLPWLDVAAQITQDSFTFNALLGSGGGSDGNTHFSDNFMQNLWECLPDFKPQRTHAIDPPSIQSALFSQPAQSLRPKRTAALYDSGAVGGPNAGVGMERGSLTNPWNFVLALEGTLSLAGTVTKRQGVATGQASVFPFAVRMTAVGFGSGVDKEYGQNEVWLPIWDRSLSIGELHLLFSHGRAEVGKRPARTGLDFARAVASAGTDAGITAFARYGIVRGRVGGENYNTAVFAGAFIVNRHEAVGLLEQIDPWLDSFRQACRTKDQGAERDPPSRFPSALRRIDSAIFDFCKYGGPNFLADILAALGAAERELAVGDVPPDKRRVRRPLGRLSAEWINACDDGSVEFRLARSLAFLRGHPEKTGSIRRYLEPVKFDKGRWTWTERSGHVVWSGPNLARNLGAVLAHRLMDAERAGENPLPLDSVFPAALADVARFLAGDTDDERLADLLWGLMLIDQNQAKRSKAPPGEAPLLPSTYALLKLTLLPGRLEWMEHAGKVVLEVKRPQADEETSGIAVKPEPAIIAKLRAGDVQAACEIAARRLRASGLMPLASYRGDGSLRQTDWSAGGVAPERLLAALLYPIRYGAVNYLAELVLRRPAVESLT